MSATSAGVANDCFEHVKTAIESINKNRSANILDLFSYINDQGFAEGSAYGSLDHELLGMSGFAHSMFLMRNELKSAGKLDGVIDAMKYYSEMGEVYQTSFEFAGSTADRIRSA